MKPSELPGVSHYSLHLQVFPGKEQLEAQALVRITNHTGRTFIEIPFILYRLLEVQAVSDGQGASLHFTQSVVEFKDRKGLRANALTVELSKPLPPGATAEILIAYSGRIHGYPEVMAYVQDRIARKYSLIRPDALAYPILAYPTWQSNMNAMQSVFTFDVQVAVPSGYTAASGGELTDTLQEDETTVFSYRSKVPTWRMDVAVANFDILMDEAEKLLVYALPEDSEGAARVLGAVKEAVEFYSESFGEVKQYHGYAVIEIPDGWGSQAGDYYILQTAAAFRDIEKTSEIYHELAHTWNVKAKPEVQRCRWFDEAFASYFEALALREFRGQAAFTQRMAQYREAFIQAAAKDKLTYDTPIAQYADHELGANSYTKGAWALYVLHQLAGEREFNQIVRSFLSQFSDKPASFTDFQTVAQEVLGRSLSRFFDDWIFTAASSQYLTSRMTLDEIVSIYCL